MPHLSIEYSAGLEGRTDLQALCEALSGAMLEAGIFPKAGVRVRAHRADFHVVADGHPKNNFAAMTLSAGAGRSTDDLKKAGELIFAAARTSLADCLAEPHFALSLEIRVIDPELSWKDTPIHARLSGKI